MMRKFLVIAVLLTVAVSLTAAERLEEQVFQVEPGARLSLDSHKGFIKIRTAAVSTIEVRVRIHTEDDPKLLDYMHIEYTETPRGISIKAKQDQDGYRDVAGAFAWRGTSWPMVDFDILMPDDGSLLLETHKSQVDVAAPMGEVRVESHKGEGTITGIRNHFDLETHKGNFDVEILEMGDLRVSTHKGDVDITVQRSGGFTVEGHTHKGSISFPGLDIRPRSKRDDGRDRTLYHKEGDGRSRIELDTHKGDIKIKIMD